MSNEHDYDDGIIQGEFAFKLKGVSYVLREPTEDANIRFRAAQFKGAKMVDGRFSTDLERMTESQSLLVSLCVYDSADKLVPQSTVRTWPSRVIKDLFNRAKKMGGLDEEESAEDLEKKKLEIDEKILALKNGHTVEARVKNSLSATADI